MSRWPQAHPEGEGSEGGLAVDGLCVGYGGADVVRDVTLRAAAGEVTALVGPNGAGKSTLLQAVVGLVQPRCGSVELYGKPLASSAAMLAYLPQRAALDWDFPAQVRDVVAMGRYPRRRLRRSTPADAAAVDAALERTGLTGLARRPIHQLSGGEQQRTLLARAFAQEAEALVLDEPFDGVDATTEHVLLEQLRTAADEGLVVLVVHHDLATVAGLADVVAVLSGQLVAVGDPQTTLTAEIVARAYSGLAWDPRMPKRRGA